MKTIKFMFIAIFAIITVSCQIDDTPDTNWYTENLEVKERDWKLKGGEFNEIGSYYECVFYNVPYVDGVISVYMYNDFGTSAEVQIPLPYTVYGVEDAGDGSEIYYSIQYSYDIAVDGTIAFKVYVSDYMTGLFHPGTETFRVAIVW